MLDTYMRRVIDPPLNAAGKVIAARGIGADQVTLIGIALGLAAAAAIIPGWFGVALLLMLASRLADGLDGAVARAGQKTDFGGYLDISVDFLFYSAIPLGFILHDPALNGVAGGLLLSSFCFNCATFLGFAVLAEKREMETDAQGAKSLYYSVGLLEGTETIAFFAIVLIWPGLFPVLGIIYAGLAFLTAILRLILAKRVFGGA